MLAGVDQISDALGAPDWRRAPRISFFSGWNKDKRVQILPARDVVLEKVDIAAAHAINTAVLIGYGFCQSFVFCELVGIFHSRVGDQPGRHDSPCNARTWSPARGVRHRRLLHGAEGKERPLRDSRFRPGSGDQTSRFGRDLAWHSGVGTERELTSLLARDQTHRRIECRGAAR